MQTGWQKAKWVTLIVILRRLAEEYFNPWSLSDCQFYFLFRSPIIIRPWLAHRQHMLGSIYIIVYALWPQIKGKLRRNITENPKMEDLQCRSRLAAIYSIHKVLVVFDRFSSFLVDLGSFWFGFSSFWYVLVVFGRFWKFLIGFGSF